MTASVLQRDFYWLPGTNETGKAWAVTAGGRQHRGMPPEKTDTHAVRPATPQAIPRTAPNGPLEQEPCTLGDWSSRSWSTGKHTPVYTAPPVPRLRSRYIESPKDDKTEASRPNSPSRKACR